VSVCVGCCVGLSRDELFAFYGNKRGRNPGMLGGRA